MKVVLDLAAKAIGCCIGTAIFLVAATYFIGDPFGDWLDSALGILIKPTPLGGNGAAQEQIANLIKNGSIVSADSVISNITSLYGNLIQVLVGAFALLGIFSFFAVRWQSIQKAEDLVDAKIEKHLSSNEFQQRLNKLTSDAFDIHAEPLESIISEAATLRQRLSDLEQIISTNASEDEPVDPADITEE